MESPKAKMEKLIVRDSFVIIGRSGTCYSLNLEENNLPQDKKEVKELLMGKEVEIFDVKCKVIGLEMWTHCENIAIFIKPI